MVTHACSFELHFPPTFVLLKLIQSKVRAKRIQKMHEAIFACFSVDDLSSEAQPGYSLGFSATSLVPAFMASSLQECSFPILSAFVTPVLASQLHAQLVDSSACRSMQTSPNRFCIQHSKVFVFLVIYTQLQCKSGFAKSHFLPVAFRNQKE